MTLGFGAVTTRAADECGAACAHGVEEDVHEQHTEREDERLLLSEEQRRRFGIESDTAGPGRLRTEMRLPGQVVFNGDRVVHVVPRATGVAREVRAGLGETVTTGDVVAVLDSTELAEGKLAYVAAFTEVGCCQLMLPRAQAIKENTLKMLDALNDFPGVEALQDAVPGEMGEYRSTLVTAYAEYVLSKEAYSREKTLVEKKVSSESELLVAENAFKKAHATYLGARDSVAYNVTQALLEAEREQKVAALAARAAEQRLLMFGLSREEIEALPNADDQAPAAHAGTSHECSDPNCKGCQAAAAAAATAQRPVKQGGMGLYAMKAPFGGVIVEKHMSRGERLEVGAEAFTIVDTSEVWVDLAVYAKDLSLVQKGQDVVLRGDHSGAQARGTIAMVTPFIEESTRSATARVVLDNADGRWVPGTFVSGFISTDEQDIAIVIPRDAVQSIEGEDVVFIEHEGAFETVPVTVGRSDRTSVEIIAGLKGGERFIAKGAFHLKATLMTRDLDPHAGHGH
jgi:multidrug efflux pump subunit AcrA (membrane-fusion protein)